MILDIFYKEQSFDSGFKLNCFRNCIQQILSYYEVGNEKYYINCVPKIELIKDIENSHFGYRLIDQNDFKIVLPKYEKYICVHMEEDMNTEQVWESNKEMLQKNIPIIVGVDGIYLDYQHLKQHSVHAAILCGYDIKNVLIIDWYGPWYFKGTISIEDFLKARSSKTSLAENYQVAAKNLWIEVKSEGWNASLEELLLQTLQLMVDSYYHVTSNDIKHFYGIYAFRELACLIQANDILESKGLNFYIDLHHKLFKYLTMKRLFLFYLKSAYEEITIVELEQLIVKTEELIQIWNLICSYIYKASFRKNTEGINDSIANKINDTIVLEVRLYEDIENCIVAIQRRS